MCNRKLRRGAGVGFWAILVAAAGSLGCAGPNGEAGGGWTSGKMMAGGDMPDRMESGILVRVCRDLVDEAIAARKDTPASEAPVTKPERLVDEMRMAAPGVFRVTAEQERLFADGKFDETANRKRMDELAGALNARGASLPTVTRNLIEQHCRGQLVGARLEFAVRLLGEQVGRQRSAT